MPDILNCFTDHNKNFGGVVRDSIISVAYHSYMPSFAKLMSPFPCPNKDETAVHGCHNSCPQSYRFVQSMVETTRDGPRDAILKKNVELWDENGLPLPA